MLAGGRFAIGTEDHPYPGQVLISISGNRYSADWAVSNDFIPGAKVRGTALTLTKEIYGAQP